jgi:hypothetical protein
MSKRDSVHLPGSHQPANDFAYFAASRQGSEEKLHIFHARGNYRLQVDGGKY